MERHHTSVYSEYEHNDNTSINSKQLEYWLHQIKTPQQSWTLMSNNSNCDQISFGRNNTYQSPPQSKENNSFNSNKQTQRTKSFVNAMVALQKRAQTLQEENINIKANFNFLKDQKTKSLTQSFAVEEQLRNRIEFLQPKLLKMEQLVKQNKKLRQLKDQKIQRAKIIQKTLKETQKQLDKQINQNKNLQKQKITLEEKINKIKEEHKKLQETNKNLKDKIKSIEETKQKSNSNLLQKYNKSVQLYQNSQKNILKLQIQLTNSKKKQEEQIKLLQQKSKKQAQQMKLQNQRLSYENLRISQQINQYKQEIKILKQEHRKKDSQILNMLKQSRIIKKTDMSKQSEIINLPHTIVVEKKIQEQQWDDESQIDMDLGEQSKQPVQTKSVEKQIKIKKKKQKSVVSSQKVQSPNQNSKQPTPKPQRNYIKLPIQKSKKSKSKIIQSYEPHSKHGSLDFTNEQIIYNSVKNYQNLNYQPYQPKAFNHNDQHTLNRLMLIQAQKEAIRLYQQQQKLLSFSSENHGQRAQYIGRMKQLNEQIKLNSEKMFQLKSKI